MFLGPYRLHPCLHSFSCISPLYNIEVDFDPHWLLSTKLLYKIFWGHFTSRLSLVHWLCEPKFFTCHTHVNMPAHRFLLQASLSHFSSFSPFKLLANKSKHMSLLVNLHIILSNIFVFQPKIDGSTHHPNSANGEDRPHCALSRPHLSEAVVPESKGPISCLLLCITFPQS